MNPSPSADPEPLTVLYDGACPLCRWEIGHYQGLKARQALCFEDVSRSDFCPPPETPRAQLLARFHVRRADGRWLSGAAAFVALWARLPGWRWLAWTARLPGVLTLMELGYRLFLRVRPRLQSWVARRCQSAQAASSTPTTPN